jgi:hypothetical protein
MKNSRILGAFAAAALLGALPALVQSINPGRPDPFRLTEPKNFEAFRSVRTTRTGTRTTTASGRSPGRPRSSRTSRGPVS